MVSDPESDPDPVSVTENPSPSPVEEDPEEDPEVVRISMGTQCPLEVLDFSHKSTQSPSPRPMNIDESVLVALDDCGERLGIPEDIRSADGN